MKTIELFRSTLNSAAMVVWNGPLGVFEMNSYGEGTLKTAQMLADSNAEVIVGGGDSLAAIAVADAAHKMAHISTGGGAFLDFLAGKDLHAIAALD